MYIHEGTEVHASSVAHSQVLGAELYIDYNAAGSLYAGKTLRSINNKLRFIVGVDAEEDDIRFKYFGYDRLDYTDDNFDDKLLEWLSTQVLPEVYNEVAKIVLPPYDDINEMVTGINEVLTRRGLFIETDDDETGKYEPYIYMKLVLCKSNYWIQ